MFPLLFLLCLMPLHYSVGRTVTARQWATLDGRFSSDSDLLRSASQPADELVPVEQVTSSVNDSKDHTWLVVSRFLTQAGRALIREIADSGNATNSTGRSVAPETLTDCILSLSLPCFGRKFILFVDLVDKKERIRLLGESVVLVRRAQSRGEYGDVEEDNEVATDDGDPPLEDVVLERLENFAESRALRIRMPAWTAVTVSPNGEEGASKELDIVLDTELEDEEEGRDKKKKKKKKLLKILKKVAIGLAVILAAKLPLAILAIKFIAIKAKILSITALVILLVQKLMMGGGGGGDDCSSGCDISGSGGGGYGYGPSGGGGGGGGGCGCGGGGGGGGGGCGCGGGGGGGGCGCGGGGGGGGGGGLSSLTSLFMKGGGGGKKGCGGGCGGGGGGGGCGGGCGRSCGSGGCGGGAPPPPPPPVYGAPFGGGGGSSYASASSSSYAAPPSSSYGAPFGGGGGGGGAGLLTSGGGGGGGDSYGANSDWVTAWSERRLGHRTWPMLTPANDTGGAQNTAVADSK